MIGYLEEIYQQIKAGSNTEDIINNLPIGLNSLLEKEWERLGVIDKNSIDLLSILAFAPEAYNIKSLSNILALDEKSVENILSQFRFIKKFVGNENVELTSAYKSFLQIKLKEFQVETLMVLTKYYEGKTDEENSIVYLPALYKQSDNFDALCKLLNSNSIIRILESYKQVSIVRRNLKFMADMATERSDWRRLCSTILMDTIFSHLITSIPPQKYEIDALLSTNKRAAAIELAKNCVLPEDRLILLTKVCSYMREKNIDINDDIISNLENAVDLIDYSIDLTKEVFNKLIRACAQLFPIKASLAMRLFEKVTEEAGVKNQKDKLMDLFLLHVSESLKTDEESVEDIRSQIRNETLDDFLHAASNDLTNMTVEDVLKELDDIDDFSAKLFFLRSWCNTNRNNDNAYKVVDKAIDLIQKCSGYAPNPLHLRQIAEPLKYLKNHIVAKTIINRIDLIKSTMLKNPIDEVIRLELTLANIEMNWSQEESQERYYQTYFSVDKIIDLDSRCMILIWLLLYAKDIIPNDSKLEDEIKIELIGVYDKLLKTSADHFIIIKHLLKAVTTYDPNIAIMFAEKLNVEFRRDRALSEILRIYTEKPYYELDLRLVNDILNKIKNQSFKGWVLVQILRRFTKEKDNDYREKDKDKLIFLDSIKKTEDPTAGAYLYAYFIKWLSLPGEKLHGELYTNLVNRIELIDPLWEKVRTGFETATIISDTDINCSIKILELCQNYKCMSKLSDIRLTNVYVNLCYIITHLAPDYVNSQDIDNIIQHFVHIISIIPSTLHRCALLSDLAIRIHISGRNDLFTSISQVCLHELEKCYDEETIIHTVISISPMLYEYERKLLFKKISTLPSNLRDIALYEVIKYIFSKRPPYDDVPISQLGRRIDYPDALRICELLEYITSDVTISSIISSLVDNIVIMENNRATVRFIERQTIDIALKLKEVINSKLPDKLNIQHPGYVLVCYACLAKLRDAVPRHRASANWVNLCPLWDNLRNQALQLENTSDKVLVLAELGKKAFASNPSLSQNLIKHAENILMEINNHVDRADRFHCVAEAYKCISEKQAAEYTLQEAIKFAQICSNDEGRDHILGAIIECAHSLDQNLANHLVQSLDNVCYKEKFDDQAVSLILHNDPKKVESITKRNSKRIINQFVDKTLKSLYVGRGLIQHEAIVGKWLCSSYGQDLETISSCVLWYIENSIRSQQTQAKICRLDSIYSNIIDILDMVSEINISLNEIAATSDISCNIYGNLLSTDYLVIKAGEVEKANNVIKDWLINNVTKYVKIYDGYFKAESLNILMSISQDIRVTIVTSAKSSQALSEIKNLYEKQWVIICDQSPPETLVYVFSTLSGETPIHDRVIISDRGGLQIGTSINGLGNKDHIIKYLTLDEKIQFEKELIESLIINPPLIYKEQKLLLRTFTLEL